jgi:hypothetical protein
MGFLKKTLVVLLWCQGYWLNLEVDICEGLEKEGGN